MKNAKTLNKLVIDWSLYNGSQTSRSRQAYIDFCEVLQKRGHSLEGSYVKNSIKVLINFKCGHDSHWMTPNNYKRGYNCPKCSGKCPIQAKLDLLNMLKNNGHTLESEYVDAKTKVLINFNCGHDSHWVSPYNYKNGTRCPNCLSNIEKKAKKDFIKSVIENGHTLVGEYINCDTKVLVDFNCGHAPNLITPTKYKTGRRCPQCARNTKEQGEKELIELLQSNGHTLESEYIDAKNKVLINFNCGHDSHWMTPNNYKNGTRCPRCCNKGESVLYELLLDMFNEVETQKTYSDLKDKKLLPYDFYLPKYNLLIELDGDHHRKVIPYGGNTKAISRLNDRKHKDKLKDTYAKANAIPLLRIEYYNGKIEVEKWKDLILDKISGIKSEAS